MPGTLSHTVHSPPHLSLHIHILVFFSGLGSLEGQTLEESCQELRTKFWDFYKVGMSVGVLIVAPPALLAPPSRWPLLLTG